MTRLSKLARNIVPSMTVEMKAKLIELQGRGIDVISLTSGEPDFDTPRNITDAAHRAIDAGYTKYTAVAGILPLRKAICHKLFTENGLDYAPEEICVGTGAKQCLYNALLTLCDPGDEVILPTPCWVSYTEQVRMTGATPVLVAMDESDGYQLNVERIAAAVTPRTRLIIINSPNNPTGAVYTREGMQALAALAEERGFMVISDEIYEKLVYQSGAEFISFPSLSTYARDNTVLLNGVSKSYSMTGWRIGYTAAPRDITKGMSQIEGHTTNNANSIAQYAALEALRGPQDSVETMRLEFDRRRRYIIDRLDGMPGLSCRDVQGAFYALPNVSSYYGATWQGSPIRDSLGFCNFLLEAGHVGTVPGDAFYAPGHIRLSYASSMEDLEKAAERIEKALKLL